MKWGLFLIAVGSLLSAAKAWRRLTGSEFHDLNEDSARRRLEALTCVGSQEHDIRQSRIGQSR